MGVFPALLTMCAFGYDSLPFDEPRYSGATAGMPGVEPAGTGGAQSAILPGTGGPGTGSVASSGMPGVSNAQAAPPNGGSATGGSSTGGSSTGGSSTGGSSTGGAGTGGDATGGSSTGGSSTGGASTGGAPANAPSSVAASRQIRGSGSLDDLTTTVCVDSSNNVQIGGIFDGTANFGAGNISSGNQGSDGFFASYNSSGAHRWSTHPTLARNDATMGLASTGSGTAFAISIEQGTLTLNGIQVATGTTGGAAVGVMDANGQAVWMKRALLSTATLADANTEGVAVGASGNVLMFGAHETNLNVDGTVLNASVGSGYLAMFSSAGTLLAASTRPNYHWFQAIESTTATYAFGRTYSAPFNAAIATYTLGGVYSTVATFGAAGDDAITDAVSDGAGNIYITGYFRNSINFGGATLTTKGDLDIFVASFTSTLAHRWSVGFGSNGADQASAIAADKDGNIYVAGDQMGTINYGGGSRSISDGLFLVSLASGGAHRWSQVYDAGPSAISALAVDSNYSLYVVGATENLGIDMLGTHLDPVNGTAFLVKLLQNP